MTTPEQHLRELLETAERSAAEMTAILDAIPHAVYFSGPDGVRRCNAIALRMVGATSSQDIEYRFAEITAKFQIRATPQGEILQPESLPFHRALRGEATQQDLWITNVETGQNVLLRVHAAPVRIGGQVVGAIAVHQDITEQFQLQEELREANQRKSDFLATLSHELRNPLAAVRNGLYILDRVAPDRPQFDRAKQLVKRQVDHLVNLVDDLLDITRISYGKIVLDRGHTDAREILSRSYEDVRLLFEQAHIELSLSSPAEPVWIDADATRVRQVLGNLLHNAAKFTPSGGTTQLVLCHHLGQCELRIRDSGAGIEPTMLDRIFEPFTQTEPARGQAKGGMGLGLALVKSLVTLHGGSVQAFSAGVGQGSEFVVWLPIAAPPPAAVLTAAPPTSAPLRILLIEDNPDAGQSLADLLALQGHEVQLVTSGRVGVSLVQKSQPDVLICDVGLPDISGHQVIRELRSSPGTEGLFAIALTGYAQPEDRRRALAAGFNSHLAKPPDEDELAELLAKATAQQTAQLGVRRPD